MIGARDRILHVEETEERGYAMRVRGDTGLSEAQAHDAPPEQFVERVRDEGGDVYLAPLVEALRDLLGRRRSGTREPTLPASSDNS